MKLIFIFDLDLRFKNKKNEQDIHRIDCTGALCGRVRRSDFISTSKQTSSVNNKKKDKINKKHLHDKERKRETSVFKKQTQK